MLYRTMYIPAGVGIIGAGTAGNALAAALEEKETFFQSSVALLTFKRDSNCPIIEGLKTLNDQ